MLILVNLTVIIGDFDPQNLIFHFIQNYSVYEIIYSSQNANFKSHGYIKFGFCIIARKNAKVRLKIMLKITLVFEKSEPHYAHECYAYK